MVHVSEHEIVVAKMRVQEDRLHARESKLEKEELAVDAKIRDKVS